MKIMDVAHELHRQQLIKAYNNAVKRKDWQAARNYRDELNILIAKKIALSWILAAIQQLNESRILIATAGFENNLFKKASNIKTRNSQVEENFADKDRLTGLIAENNRRQYIHAHSTSLTSSSEFLKLIL